MEIREVFNKVFMWMCVGLLITFGVGFYVASNPNMILNIFDSSLLWVVLIVQILIVIILSRMILKMSYFVAAIMFMLYSFITGLTFSFIFIIYEMGSIILIFGLTAAVFGLFAFLGHVTNIDLTRFRSIFLMGLIGIIIASIINFFIGSEFIVYVLSWLTIGLFAGITAYDIQKIKKMAQSIEPKKVAIIGALSLYLDFINIFLSLLRIFGRRR